MERDAEGIDSRASQPMFATHENDYFAVKQETTP